MEHHHDSMDMDMTSTANMPSSTESSTDGHHDMGGMSMSMADMAMTFFTSSNTPLFANSWTPGNDGSYAGTCIFLIALAMILRLLLALRPILETRLWRRRTSARNASLKHSTLSEEEEEQAMLATRQPRQTLGIVGKDVRRGWSGWRVGSAASRATYEMIIAGVAYLLMLGVMTMNVGYFLSILGGVWLGTFVLGSLSYDDRYTHC